MFDNSSSFVLTDLKEKTEKQIAKAIVTKLTFLIKINESRTSQSGPKGRRHEGSWEKAIVRGQKSKL